MMIPPQKNMHQLETQLAQISLPYNDNTEENKL